MPPITAPRITPKIPVAAAMIVGSIRLLLLPVRQHCLQISVISFRSRPADEAHFFRFARCGDADALRADGRFFFAVVIIKDLILVTVDREVDLSQVKPLAEVMRVLELLLRAGSIFRKLKLDLAGQTKAILQVTVLAGQIFRSADGNNFRWTFDGTTEDDAFIPGAE